MISKSKARMVRRLTVRRMREREGLALAEGPRVVLEALRSPLEVTWAVVGAEYADSRESGRRLLASCRERGVEVLVAPDREVMELASTVQPQPVVACVRVPPPGPRSLDRGRYLMPMGLRIPGNLGTLIRSAWGFGLDGIVVGPGNVDPWSPKVVRASAGAVFHLPVIAGPGVQDDRGDARVNLLCADAGAEPLGGPGREVPRHWVLALGSETGGLPEHLVRRARAISIPMAAGVDSLNVAVAGSILMYLLTRRME